MITLDNLRPHAKNPTIANFFSQLGLVEELGRGTRALYEYVPKISGGRMPVIEEMDEFKVVIPYVENMDIMGGEPQNEPQNETNGPQNEPQNLSKNERQKKVLELIESDETISKGDLCVKFGVHLNTIKRDLKALGLVWEGSSKTGHWVRK